jgi:phosphate starvation-inducible PhoH-like protein
LAKRLPKTSRKNRRSDTFAAHDHVAHQVEQFGTPPVRHKVTEPLRAKTEAQGQYLAAIQSSEIVFGIGPAGTGKTYVAASWAAQQLLDKRIDRIVVTRPNVESGEEMGHLPGELEDKFAPYLAPFRDVMVERMGQSHYEYSLKREYVKPEPIGFMRGKTFNDCVVILDEAQNITPEQMKMFLTRIGRNCTMIIDGDVEQCDLKGKSGLEDALWRMEGIPGVRIVEFTEDDIVRNGIIKSILKAYRR